MGATLTVNITQNSQSITNNTSNVTVNAVISWTYGSWNALGQCSGSITIDGTKYSFSGMSFNTGHTTSGKQTVMTKTVNVSHNSDGTKSLKFSASFNTEISAGTIGASATKTLTTIPRKSTLSVGNGTLNTAQTLTVSRKSTSFTHTITATCSGSTSTICTKSTAGSFSFTPPIAWTSKNTTGTSVSVTYTITTYNGNTSVGSNSYTKTCTIPTSVKPSCTVSVTDAMGYEATYGNPIKGLSKFKVTVTPTLAYSSPIASYSTTANGATYTSASFTTDVLKTSGTLTVKATVKDKRGRTSATTSTSKTVLDYSAPNISMLKVGRCDEDGTANDQGDCIKVTFTYSISTLNGKNRCTAALSYKKSSESNYTTASGVVSGAGSQNTYIIKQADTGASYNVKLSVTDNFNTTAKTTSASTAFTIMHWNADGTAMAIGKVSEESNLFDIGLPIRFYGGILHPILEAGTNIDEVRTPNTYVGRNISSNEYTGTFPPVTSGTFTLEVIGAGPDGQVNQIFKVCDKTNSMSYERVWYTNSWGDWLPVMTQRRLRNIFGTSYTLTTTATPATNYSLSSDSPCSAVLVGNSLRCYMNVTRSSASESGNIVNEKVCTFKVNHGGKIKNAYAVSFISGSTGALAAYITSSQTVDDTYLTFDVYMNANASAVTQSTSNFVVPVLLDVDAY